ncbi:unnamed protein product [Ambrosiozyma monospora]|uniref:Unnamed protein product n=1 Tax=Ambrosiozyma monospora TaxID=43982 RepID=A0A9W6Z006_AMBMO|nr:unnamed protein product [Ambrosiozyma monospora]
MNVIVYSGPGTTPETVKHCLETLRLLLSPNYVVNSVNASTIRDQPWSSKTSMIVIPGGADLPVTRELNGKGNQEILKFIKKGGKFLGFCSGGYYGSSRVEFEVGDPKMEVSGSRELKLFPGTSRGAAFKGFNYHSDVGARAVQLKVNKDSETGLPAYEQDTVVNYFNGGGVFIDAKKYPNTKVLATYADPVEVEDPSGLQAAVILCKVGEGQVMLSGTHPEFTPDLLHESSDAPNMSKVIPALRIHDKARLEFLRCCLKKMGLKVNDSSAMVRPSLTPLYLSSVDNGVSASQLIKSCS